MTMPLFTRRGRRARLARREGGAALVEFALVVPLLGLLLFGVIEFGFVLSYRHSVGQSAAEGARAALIDYAEHEDMVAARAAGRSQADASMSSWEPTCDQGDADGDGLGCLAYTHDCDYPIEGVLPPGILQADIDTAATPDCISVVVTHDYVAKPLLPVIPLLGAVLPDRVESVSTIQVTP